MADTIRKSWPRSLSASKEPRVHLRHHSRATSLLKQDKSSKIRTRIRPYRLSLPLVWNNPPNSISINLEMTKRMPIYSRPLPGRLSSPKQGKRTKIWLKSPEKSEVLPGLWTSLLRSIREIVMEFRNQERREFGLIITDCHNRKSQIDHRVRVQARSSLANNKIWKSYLRKIGRVSI